MAPEMSDSPPLNGVIIGPSLDQVIDGIEGSPVNTLGSIHTNEPLVGDHPEERRCSLDNHGDHLATQYLANSEEHVPINALRPVQGDGEIEERADDHGSDRVDTVSNVGSDDGLFVSQTNTSEVEVETEDERDAGIPSQDLNAHLDQATQSDDDDADDADEGNYGDSDDDPMNDSGDDDGVDNDNSAGSNEHSDLGNQHDNDEYNNHHGEDDDECMIIDGQDLPDSLKAKFAEQEFGAWGDGAAAEDVVYMGTRIKMEENDGVNYSVTSESSSDNDGTEFEVDENDDLSDGERPRKRPRRPTRQQGKQKQKSKKTTPGRNNTEPKGKQGDEEWIEPTDEELTELATQRERLRARKARGQNLTLSQKLTLAQVTARLKEIETKAAEQDAEVDDQAIEQALAKVKARVQLPSASGRLSPAPFENAADANMEGLSQAPGSSKPQTARKKPPRSAKEYWERVYANNGFAQDSGASKAGKRKRQTRGRGKKNTKKGAGRESRLMRMLQDVNPIMARAAQGAVIMPGPVQTKRLDDQLKAMKAFRFKISSNPNTRSPSVDLRMLREATRSFGLRGVRAENNMWRLKGMKSTLYNHQLVGVRWMVGQELSPDGPYGGILADQMGLGKTVQVLAAMSVNQPSPEDRKAGRHQTLIVAPAVAINQWRKEIEKHCEKSFIRVVHHYQAKQKLQLELWKSADVVLVSYNEVSNAYPSEQTLKRFAGMKLSDEEWGEKFDQELGELFRTEFFRVVLDEGHAIRNLRSKTSKACQQLSSKFRWILSGTPLHNSIDELYAYFRFLGAHYDEDYGEFCKRFGDIEKDGVKERLDAMVTSLMLRRHVHDHFAGVPILEIPQTHPIRLIWVDLTQAERLIYRRLESRFRDNMSNHIKARVAEKKLRTYLAYLTRLRQAVGHPYLLEGVLKSNFTLEDFHYLKRQLSLMHKTPMHRQIKRWMDIEYSDVDGEMVFGRSRFGETFDMDSQFQEMEANAQMADIICRMCYELPVDPRITECGHTFCAQCINDRLQLSESCPCCKVLLHNVDYLKEPERRLVEDPDADGCQKKSKERKRKKDKREIGEDEHGVQLKLKDSSKWIREYDESHPYKPLLASAKTIAVKSQILAWQRQAPEDKIIVFVNWAKLAGIIGRMLFEEHIPFLYYFGDMTKGQKIAAVADFEDRPEIKVLIASIRCGGQALNLNFANRVISVDQWWNTAMENQAFGRVHRIGQRKETYFVKIAVKDTVDERLLAMQGDKDRLIRQALQEDAAHRTAPTLEELMKLFGVDAAENEAGELVVAPAAEDEGAGDGNGNGNGVGGDNAGEVIEIGDDSDGNGEAAERASLDGE